MISITLIRPAILSQNSATFLRSCTKRDRATFSGRLATRRSDAAAPFKLPDIDEIHSQHFELRAQAPSRNRQHLTGGASLLLWPSLREAQRAWRREIAREAAQGPSVIPERGVTGRRSGSRGLWRP